MIMKKNYFILFICFILTGCSNLVNKVSFFPDTLNVVDKTLLPKEIQAIKIPTIDGLKIEGYFLKMPTSNYLLIYFHGNAGNIGQRLKSLTLINQIGINVLAVGYRGYGLSEGKPSEKGIYIDGQSALNYAHQLGFKNNQIILFGRSLGTTVAIHNAQNLNLAGLILISPLTSGNEMAEQMGIGWLSFLTGNPFNSLSKINHILVPTLIIHGTEDQMIPVKMAKQIYQELSIKKQLKLIKGAGHNDLQNYAKYWRTIEKFIRELK